MGLLKYSVNYCCFFNLVSFLNFNLLVSFEGAVKAAQRDRQRKREPFLVSIKVNIMLFISTKLSKQLKKVKMHFYCHLKVKLVSRQEWS